MADLGGSIINDATVALGVPLGSDPALVQRLALNEIKADNFFRVLALPSMPSDVHDTVLRVAGLPRGNYLTRVGYPGEYSQALDYFDGQMESHAAISLGMSLDALRRSPLTLASARSPIRSAGLGYLALADISPFALWGALANAAPALTRVFQQRLPPILERAAQTALTAIRDQLDTDPAAKFLPPLGITDMRECLAHYCHPRNRFLVEHLQRNLRRKALSRAIRLRRLSAPPLHGAAITCSMAKGASALLTLLPANVRPATAARQQALRMRCLAPPAESMPPRCHCGADMREDPWHPLSHSSGSRDGIHGHNEIARLLARYISKASGRAWLEPRFQIRAEDDQHTDVKFVFGPIMGYIDVYVVHPTAASYLRRATAPLRIAAEVEAMKNAKYAARAAADHALFFPFVVETFGGLGDCAREFIRLLTRQAAELSVGWLTSHFRADLARDIALALATRNLRLLTTELNACHAAERLMAPLTSRAGRPRAPASAHPDSVSGSDPPDAPTGPDPPDAPAHPPQDWPPPRPRPPRPRDRPGLSELRDDPDTRSSQPLRARQGSQRGADGVQRRGRGRPRGSGSRLPPRSAHGRQSTVPPQARPALAVDFTALAVARPAAVPTAHAASIPDKSRSPYSPGRWGRFWTYAPVLPPNDAAVVDPERSFPPTPSPWLSNSVSIATVACQHHLLPADAQISDTSTETVHVDLTLSGPPLSDASVAATLPGFFAANDMSSAAACTLEHEHAPPSGEIDELDELRDLSD